MYIKLSQTSGLTLEWPATNEWLIFEFQLSLFNQHSIFLTFQLASVNNFQAFKDIP